MIEVTIYMNMKTLWKRTKNKLIIARLADHDLKDSSQDDKSGRSRKGIYNQETLSQDIISFKRIDYGMDIGRIDWG